MDPVLIDFHGITSKDIENILVGLSSLLGPLISALAAHRASKATKSSTANAVALKSNSEAIESLTTEVRTVSEVVTEVQKGNGNGKPHV